MLDDQWFSEPVASDGSAFSLKIKRKLHEEQSAFQFWKYTKPSISEI